MRQMTVKLLRDIISESPEDAVVLISDHHHGYRFGHVEVSTALEENTNYGQYLEDHGEQYTPEAEFGKRVSAVIIS